ncbi:MAG: hypothetical protein ACE14L_07455 [Terriglobales bacterium]
MRKYLAAVVVFALACSLSAMAAEGTTKVVLRSAVQLDGKQINPGEYKVKWSGTNDDLQVTFTADKKDVVTTKAKLVDRPTPAPSTAVITEETSLKEIWVGNQKTAIVFAH